MYDAHRNTLTGVPSEYDINTYIIKTTDSSKHVNHKSLKDYFTITVLKGDVCRRMQDLQTTKCPISSALTVFSLIFTVTSELSVVDKVFLIEATAAYLHIHKGLFYLTNLDLASEYKNVQIVLSGPDHVSPTFGNVWINISFLVGCGDVSPNWLAVLEHAEHTIRSQDMHSHMNDTSMLCMKIDSIAWNVYVIKPSIEPHRVKREVMGYHVKSTPVPFPVLPQRNENHISNVIKAYPPADPINPMWGFGVGRHTYPSDQSNPMMSDQHVVPKKNKKIKNRAINFKNRHDKRWRRRQRKRKERRRRRKEKRVLDELRHLLPSVEDYDQIRASPTHPPTEEMINHNNRIEHMARYESHYEEGSHHDRRPYLEPTPLVGVYQASMVSPTPALERLPHTDDFFKYNGITNDKVIISGAAPQWHGQKTSPTLTQTHLTQMTLASDNIHGDHTPHDRRHIGNQNEFDNVFDINILGSKHQHHNKNGNHHNRHNENDATATTTTHSSVQHNAHHSPHLNHDILVVPGDKPEGNGNQYHKNVQSDQFNYGPIVLNGINRLEVEVGDILDFQIPKNTFYDHEDGDASHLRLHLLTDDGDEMTSTSWIKFNKHTRAVYAMPIPENVGIHTFVLSATDSGGKNVYEVFEIVIRQRTNQWRINHEFSLSLDLEYQRFLRDIDQRIDVTKKLASVYGDDNARHIRVTRVEHGSVVLSWTNKTMHSIDCPLTEISYLVGHFMDQNNNISRRLIDSMYPYKVLQVGASCKGSCKRDIENNHIIDGNLHADAIFITAEEESSNSTFTPVTVILSYSSIVVLFIFIVSLLVVLVMKYCTKHTNKPTETRNIKTRTYFANIRRVQCHNYSDLKSKQDLKTNQVLSQDR